MSRILGAMVVAVALAVAQAAFADDAPPPASPPPGPLTPGTAAGIHAAQTDAQLNTIVIVAAAGLAAVAVFLIAGTHYHVSGQNQSASGTK
jgi:hypothetical protein